MTTNQSGAAEVKPQITMKLNKTLGSVLYELYGPNGSDAVVCRGEARRMAVFLELQRHGLVEVIERSGEESGLFDAKRTCRGLRGSTLCEVFGRDA